MGGQSEDFSEKRKQAFSVLRPACVEILRQPNAKVFRLVDDVLHRLEPQLVAEIPEYLLQPLLMSLSRHKL
jgi:hypothetical protein